jgi:hypothetical protein
VRLLLKPDRHGVTWHHGHLLLPVPDVWLLFDDDKVTVCPDSRPVATSEAYLLFYTRVASSGGDPAASP